MRNIFFIILLFGNFTFAQNVDFESRIVYNRVGLALNPSLLFSKKNHQFEIGLKIYGYNLYFEKTPVGPKIGYNYKFLTENKKAYFKTGFHLASFHENKLATNLWLNELTLSNGFGIRLNDKLDFVQSIGFGLVLSHTNINAFKQIFSKSYSNYEVSVGLAYHIN